MTTAELQAIPRSITGTIKSVDSDNKAWLEQTKPKLEHPVGYFIRGPELVDLLKSLEGQTVNLIIGPDRIKKDRADDGNFASYWWSIRSEETSDEAPPVQAPPKPQDPAPRSDPPARTPAPKDQPFEIPPNPAALGACHNHAVDFIVRGVLPIPEGRELFGWVRELRDRFYREINQAPVAPLHYCYQHDQERRQGKTGAWGHLIPETSEDAESWCVEGAQ